MTSFLINNIDYGLTGTREETASAVQSAFTTAGLRKSATCNPAKANGLSMQVDAWSHRVW